MELQKLEKLGDLFGHNLTGWQITWCHFLELDHGPMGIFPAITIEDKEIVAVLDKKLLRRVYDRLERRQAKITSLMVIINTENEIAFNLESYHKTATRSLRILSNEALNALCQKDNPFRWGPGLFGGSDKPVIDPKFDS